MYGPMDLTAQARIRDAAIHRFPRDGYRGTSVRAIADDAGVSPALVLHHFGSKEGLKRACDEHVFGTFRRVKEEALSRGGLFEGAFIADGYRVTVPLLRYMAWTFTRDNGAAADLFDELVAETVGQLEMGEEHGLVRPGEDQRGRALALLCMRVGMLVLHPHLSRILGKDVLTVEGAMALSRPFMEILSKGILTDAAASGTDEAMAAAAAILERDEGDD